MLEEAGASVLYREYPLPHAIDPGFLPEVREWLARVAAVASEQTDDLTGGRASRHRMNPDARK